MSPVSSYANLFSLTGPTYVAVAFIARLPLAMSQLGALLLVSGVTGSYGAGGAAAGALAVANAVGSPIAGSLTDRIGQRPVLLVQSLVGALGLIGLVLLTQQFTTGDAWWPLIASAAAAGLFLPQVGVMARVRWRPIGERRGGNDHGPRSTDRMVSTAFSYEGAADEASFVLGPALVGAFGAALNPGAALLIAASILLAFGIWFAVHPTAALVRPQPRRREGARLAPAIVLSLAVMVTVQFCLGLVFGSVQTGTSVLATAAGEPGMTGLFHGILGIGSMAAGLAVVMLPERFGFATRLQAFTGALALFSLPLLWVDSLGALVPVLLVLGLAIAPAMITTFSVAERITPGHRLGAVMTVLASVTGLGYAVGSSVAGRLADWGGHGPAYAVTVVACVLAMTVSLPARRLHTGSQQL